MAKKSTKPAGQPAGESVYDRRIRRYLESHPGSTRQQARGKGPAVARGGEAKERRARERERGGLTTDDRQAIRKFAAEQAKRNGWDKNAAFDRMHKAVQRRGMDWFRDLRTERNRLHREHGGRQRSNARRRQGRNLIVFDQPGRGRRTGAMRDYVDGLDLDVVDDNDAWGWLYYH